MSPGPLDGAQRLARGGLGRGWLARRSLDGGGLARRSLDGGGLARRSSGGGSGLSLAIRAAPPICDLGLVDLVPHVVDRRKTGGGADRAVYIDQTAADSTDQMVMVVADPILETSRCAGGLNAPEEAFGDQDAERVVHGLERDGTDPGPDDLGHAVGRDVGLTCHRP